MTGLLYQIPNILCSLEKALGSMILAIDVIVTYWIYLRLRFVIWNGSEFKVTQMNLKYQEIPGFVQKASLLNPSSLGLAPYAQAEDI